MSTFFSQILLQQLRIQLLNQRDSDSELLANRKPLLVSKDTFGCHIYDRDYTTRDYFFVPLQTTVCFMLSNADYKAIILSQQKINAVSFLNFVKSVTFFKQWQHNKLQAFCGGLYIKNYKKGDGIQYSLSFNNSQSCINKTSHPIISTLLGVVNSRCKSSQISIRKMYGPEECVNGKFPKQNEHSHIKQIFYKPEDSLVRGRFS